MRSEEVDGSFPAYRIPNYKNRHQRVVEPDDCHITDHHSPEYMNHVYTVLVTYSLL